MNQSIEILSKVLDATALRQKVLANNLANVNTPQFKRMDVHFRDALAKAVQSNSPQDIAGIRPQVVEDTVTPCRPDGNNVSLQKEMGEMAENSLLYSFSAKMISKKFEGLHKAIRGM